MKNGLPEFSPVYRTLLGIGGLVGSIIGSIALSWSIAGTPIGGLVGTFVGGIIGGVLAVMLVANRMDANGRIKGIRYISRTFRYSTITRLIYI